MQTTVVSSGVPTWSGAAVRRERWLPAVFAYVALLAAFVFEVVASGALFSKSGVSGPMPDESWFHTWAWRYDYGAAFSEYAHAPLLVFGGLLAGAIALEGIVGNGLKTVAVRKAKGRMLSTRGSFPAERARLDASLAAAGVDRLTKRGVRARLLVAGLSALVAAAISLIPPGTGFSSGVGRVVVLVASLTGVVGVLLARPWAPALPVLVGADGQLFAGTDLQPVATPATVVAPLAPVVPTPMPAAWYPDPSGRHELRYWDGTAWTSHVSDHGQPGEDQPIAA